MLERGAPRDTNPDFMYPIIHDELRYAQRHQLMQDVRRDGGSSRNNANETALPMRQLGWFTTRAKAWAEPASIGMALPGAGCRGTMSR